MVAFENRLRKLRKSMDHSVSQLRVFREKRKNALDQFVGTNYSEEGARDKVPVNFIELAASIYQRLLVSSTPQVSILTQQRHLKPVGADLELVTNHLLRKMNFKSELESVVQEALFGMGVMKVGMSEQHVSMHEHDPGQYFAACVSFEDFVYDVMATRYEDVAYAGNRYRVPLRDVLDNPHMDPNVKDKLRSMDRADFLGGDADQRAESLLSGPKRFDEAFDSVVELWDIWLPRENLIVTFPADDALDALWVREWVGPARGPYHLLRFEKVPKNIMPLPPAALWMDMHDLANRLFRKLARQAERQKTVLGVQSNNAQDGERFVNASDGEAIPMLDPTSAKEIRTGGPDAANNTFLMQIRTLFNMMSGNVEMLGGISATTDTVGQDQLLNRNASERIKAMQDVMVNFTSDVCADLAWWVWDDPFVDVELSRKITGTSIEVPVRFNQEAKQGDYFDYEFQVIPHSLRLPSPQERLAGINQILTQVVMPMYQLLQQQGIGVNFDEYFRLAAKYMSIPELNDLLTFSAPMTGESPQTVPSAGPQVGTARRYIRENVSRGMTPEARDSQLAMVMASRQLAEASNG